MGQRRRHRYAQAAGAAVAAGRALGNYARGFYNKRRASSSSATSTRSRKKARHGSSFTKRQKGSKGAGSNNSAGNTSSFKWLKRMRKKNLPWKVVGQYYKSYQLAGSAASDLGRQRVIDGMYINQQGDINDLRDIIKTATTSQATTNVFLKQCDATYMLTNCETASMEVTFFDCICKRSTYVGPAQAFIDGMTAPFEGDGVAVITGSSGNAGQWGLHPNASKLFRQHWSIKRARRVLLLPGQTHKHIVTVAPNKLVNMTVISSQGDANTFEANFSYALLIINSGAQVDSKVGDDTMISVSTSKYMNAYTKTYRINGVLGAGDIFKTVTPLVTSFGGAGEALIEEVSGLIVAAAAI